MRSATAVCRSPFFWFALFLVAANLAAGPWIPCRTAPTAEEVPRNQYWKRAWPEYVDAERAADARLVILIGNSQGFGGELPLEQIYAARLRERFDQAGRKIQLENWAMPGSTMIDHHVALLRALERDPDLLVLMRTFEGMVLSPSQHTLNFVGMDIDHLLGAPRYWPSLYRLALPLDIKSNELLIRSLCWGVLVLLVIYGAVDTTEKFIYFQF